MANLKKRTLRQLASLRLEVKQFRQLIVTSETRYEAPGELQRFKDLRLKFRRRGPEDISDSLHRENCLLYRKIDRLRYEKGKKINECLKLQFKWAELTRVENELKETVDTSDDRAKQSLVTKYQRSMAKQNAAKAIRTTYVQMLTILKEDYIRHEALVNELKNEKGWQCAIILKATMMGQLAAETADDTAIQYRQMAERVWKAIKERERTLVIVRTQVEDLWEYVRSLTRTESTLHLLPNERAERLTNASIRNLNKEIASLEETFENVKASFLSRSYLELFKRLEDQAKQRTRMYAQFQQSAKKREICLNKRTEDLSTLSNVLRALITTNERFRTEIQVLLDQIDVLRKQALEKQLARKENGELLLEIKAALRNMLSMLISMKRSGGRSGKSKIREESSVTTITDVEKTPAIEKVETEGLNLLSEISRNVGALFGMSNFDLEPEKEQKAKDLYRSYVAECQSKLAFGQTGTDLTTGLFVEAELADSLVPTRAEIKIRSKQVVESQAKLD